MWEGRFTLLKSNHFTALFSMFRSTLCTNPHPYITFPLSFFLRTQLEIPRLQGLKYTLGIILSTHGHQVFLVGFSVTGEYVLFFRGVVLIDEPVV